MLFLSNIYLPMDWFMALKRKRGLIFKIWHPKPIGPLGAHIELQPNVTQAQAQLVENQIGNLLSSFGERALPS